MSSFPNRISPCTMSAKHVSPSGTLKRIANDSPAAARLSDSSAPRASALSRATRLGCMPRASASARTESGSAKSR